MNQELIKLAQDITMQKDPDLALSLTLIGYLEQKIEACEEQIKGFEKKYRMGFKEYEKKLGKELELSYEHEKDYLEWEGAITNLKYFRELRKKVSQYAHSR